MSIVSLYLYLVRAHKRASSNISGKSLRKKSTDLTMLKNNSQMYEQAFFLLQKDMAFDLQEQISLDGL